MAENAKDDSVVVWGLVSSGKTTLVRALTKSLLSYTGEYERLMERLQETDDSAEVRRIKEERRSKEFKYELWGADHEPITSVDPPSPDNVRPGVVGVTESKTLRFVRKAQDSVNGPERYVSSHYHVLHFDDYPGETFAQQEDGYSKFERPDLDDSHLAAFNALLAARYVVVLLDYATRNKEGYKGSIARLVEFFKDNPDSERRFAVCLTKIDTEQDRDSRYRSAWRLIENQFDPKMVDTLRGLELVGNPRDDNRGAYAVSAFGFLEDGTPNHSAEDEAVLDADQWAPFNVEYPFFALFEEIERQRLRTSGGPVARLVGRQRFYRPYPGLAR